MFEQSFNLSFSASSAAIRSFNLEMVFGSLSANAWDFILSEVISLREPLEVQELNSVHVNSSFVKPEETLTVSNWSTEVTLSISSGLCNVKPSDLSPLLNFFFRLFHFYQDSYFHFF